MSRACIALADAARARLFTFDDHAQRVRPIHPLTERIDLVCPERRMRIGELSSASRPALDRTPTGRTYGVGDRPGVLRHTIEHDFTAQIVVALLELVTSEDLRRVVLVAGPRTLGLLRRALEPVARSLTIEEVPSELTRLGTAEVHDRLAAAGILPPRERLLRAN